MLKTEFRILLIIAVLMFYTLLPGVASAFLSFGVKWDDSYSFDKSNTFKIEFYAKNNELMRTMNLKTYYVNCNKNR